MSQWLPIVVNASHMIGRHPRFARLVVVRFELDRRPPARWVDLFNRVDSRQFARPDAPTPRLLDGLVQVDARDDALDEDVAGVLLHIEAANRWYEEDLRGVTPKPLADLAGAARLQEAHARAARLTRDFGRARPTGAGPQSPAFRFVPGTPSEREF